MGGARRPRFARYASPPSVFVNTSMTRHIRNDVIKRTILETKRPTNIEYAAKCLPTSTSSHFQVWCEYWPIKLCKKRSNAMLFFCIVSTNWQKAIDLTTNSLATLQYHSLDHERLYTHAHICRLDTRHIGLELSIHGTYLLKRNSFWGVCWQIIFSELWKLSEVAAFSAKKSALISIYAVVLLFSKPNNRFLGNFDPVNIIYIIKLNNIQGDVTHICLLKNNHYNHCYVGGGPQGCWRTGWLQRAQESVQLFEEGCTNFEFAPKREGNDDRASSHTGDLWDVLPVCYLRWVYPRSRADWDCRTHCKDETSR